MAHKNESSWWSRIPLPPLVLGLDALVYGSYGFDGLLRRDYAVYLYSGQRVAQGVPPDADMTPEHRRELTRWLRSRYRREKVGGWSIARNAPEGGDSR